MTALEKLVGSWKLEEADEESYCKFLVKIGVPAEVAEKVKSVKEDQTVTLEGNTLTMTNHKLVVGETIEEKMADGRIVQTKVLEVGASHLVSSHTYPNGAVVTHRSDVLADGKTCITMYSTGGEGVVRKYVRA